MGVTLGAATTLTAGGDVTFASMLNGARTLVINNQALTALLGPVGNVTLR
jgi:hypothetical protein